MATTKQRIGKQFAPLCENVSGERKAQSPAPRMTEQGEGKNEHTESGTKQTNENKESILAASAAVNSRSKEKHH